MMDPEDVLDPLFEELRRTLKEMERTKDLAQRKQMSEIVKNLCESLGVFFDAFIDEMTGGLALDDDEDEGDDDREGIPF